MTEARIKPFQYTFSDEDIDFVLSSFGNLLRGKQFLTMGQFGQRFEDEFKAYNGRQHAVAVSSGTAALEIILRAMGVEGGKVIVPTNTFGATIIPVIRAGGVPVFADCASDMTLCPQDVARKLTSDVKAVITVHIGGLISPRTLELSKLCERNGIPLIEDAAHAAGSSLGGVKAGGFGIAAAFSFFSTKLMTTGEGGMIVTDDARIAEYARLLRNHAKAEKNRMVDHGYNWRLTEVQALLGIRQLASLDSFISERNTIAGIYDALLADCKDINLLCPSPGVVHNRYKYIMFLESISPREVEKTLRERYGIPLAGYVYEEPCHKQPAFSTYGGSDCQLAEKLCASHICLPIYQEMAVEDATFVAECLREVLRVSG